LPASYDEKLNGNLFSHASALANIAT
jgi:hypothetical protein